MFKIERFGNGEIIRWVWASNDTRMPRPLWTSTYLVDGVLIDSGPPAGTDELKEFITSLASEQAIEKVIITHWHEDHAGGARLLTETLGLPVYIPKEGIDKVREGFSYPEYRVMAWGGPLEPAPAVQPLNFILLATKSEKFSFKIIPCIGHSIDLIVLVEPTQQWCFISDSIQPVYQTIFGEPSEDIHEDMEQIYASLRNLQEITKGMDDLLIFTAGFGMFEGQKILIKNVSEIETLHKQVHELKTQGFSERKIVKKVFGGEHLVGYVSNYALSRLNLVRSLLKWSV